MPRQYAAKQTPDALAGRPLGRAAVEWYRRRLPEDLTGQTDDGPCDRGHVNRRQCVRTPAQNAMDHVEQLQWIVSVSEHPECALTLAGEGVRGLDIRRRGRE